MVTIKIKINKTKKRRITEALDKHPQQGFKTMVEFTIMLHCGNQLFYREFLNA